MAALDLKVASPLGGAIGGKGITPLMARSNTGNYTWIIIPIIIAGILIVIYLVWKKVAAYRRSSEYVAHKKKQLTTRKDVEMTARKFSLNAGEEKLLWRICRESKAPNIFYLSGDRDAVRELFRKQWETMKRGGEKADEITKLFRLLYKMELAATNVTFTSSAAIPVGTAINFSLPGGARFQCSLKANSRESMSLSIPEALYEMKEKPAPLSKARLGFSSNAGMSYNFETRVIRYDMGIDGKPEAVLACVASNISAHEARRKSLRRDMGIPCSFSAVKTVDGELRPMEKRYESVLDNISADGCCVTSKLPIKQGQDISVSIPFDGGRDVIGSIVRMRRNATDGTFFLHIKFTSISCEARNLILERVYDFSESATGSLGI